MNEHIGAGGIAFGGPHFTDIFASQDSEQYYRDSPLSPKGQEQARALDKVIGTTHEHQRLLLRELELVVVSPLTRALETMELALLPHLRVAGESVVARIPVIALPLAAERLYLISDIGRPVSQLEEKYVPVVDFESGMPAGLSKDAPWWWQAPAAEEEYHEWRPMGQGQCYSCPGEPFETFEKRMMELCQWLLKRPEKTIAIVGHFGVFEWLLQDGQNEVKFGNCEMRRVSFQEILQRRGISR